MQLGVAVTVLVAAVLLARLAVFMVDPERADLSVLPGRALFVHHSCLSAYTEAARLATTDVNVYRARR